MKRKPPAPSRCGKMVKSPTTGRERYCKSGTVPGTGFCWRHGGTRDAAKRIHGLYGKYQPPEITEILETQRNDPRLLDMREQVVLMSSLLGRALERIRERQEAFGLEPFTRKVKTIVNGKTKVTEEEVDPRISDGELKTLVSLSNQVSNAIERFGRLGVMARYLVHLDTLEQVFREWQDLAREFIPNASKRKRFNHLLQLRATRVVEENAEAKQRGQPERMTSVAQWQKGFGKSKPGVLDV